jgi:hypothetical protein
VRKDVAVALALGTLLLLAGLASLGVLLSRGEARPYLVLAGAELAAGREAAIPAGFEEGLGWRQAAAATTLLEWTMLLLGFPLLVLAGDALARVRRIEAFFHKARLRAQADPSTGVLALGALTLVPFVPIGALTSALVGEFLGLPAWRLLPVLLGAELVANVALAVSAAAILSVFPHPRIVAGAAALSLVAGALVAALLARRRRAAGP